jgi:rhodanese-related sulfurtransferase
MNNISVQELHALKSSNPAIHILDVRESEEHAEFNIGGILLPLSKISQFDYDLIEGMQEQDIYVICRSGKRSVQACMLLEQAGFSQLHNVAGGVLAWQEAFPQ